VGTSEVGDVLQKSLALIDERTNNGCYNKTMMSGVPLQMLFCLLFSPATGKKTNICIYVVKMRRQQNGGKYKNKESMEVCIIA